MTTEIDISNEVACFHCGERCDTIVLSGDKSFCCAGCKAVYEILSSNNLCQYYTFDAKAGLSQQNHADTSYDYLDDSQVRKKIVLFDSERLAKVSFVVPAIHCISCIWLLENLRKLSEGVLKSEVTFGKKTITVDFDPSMVTLSKLASMLSSLGYPPMVNLETTAEKPRSSRQLVYRLTVAGFCFGNIMLFSFPEYLGIDTRDGALLKLFSWLNLLLAVPVFFYSAGEYFSSAAKCFRQRQVNIDLPIALGLLALFSRSCFDIVNSTGPGYLDSFAGLVFFLLIGRWFQGKTYESLAFDRDFKSYFPLAINCFRNGAWTPIIIYDLAKGDRIRIRNMEIVPADSILQNEEAFFDYSFVTGEARPLRAMHGDIIYAGGKLIGQPVEMIIEKQTDQSHLTSLWNNDAFKKHNESHYRKIIDKTAQRFTWIVMGIAITAAIFWQWYSPNEMVLVLSSVLMVACPCALALAVPFTYGNILRAFGEANFYLKNVDVIERLATIDAVVFDKTGTVTHGNNPSVEFHGVLSDRELSAVKMLTGASTHPLSLAITRSIQGKTADSFTNFQEIPGKGIQAIVDGYLMRVGSAAWVGFSSKVDASASHVYVAIANSVRGYFSISVRIRDNIRNMLDRLGDKCTAMLSGDGSGDFAAMSALFPVSAKLLFNQSPYDKLEFIKAIQLQGKKVLMVGDGLNDAGALKQSDVGVAVTDDTGIFTPACDGILSGEKLVVLDKFLAAAKSSSGILKGAFAISFFYNAVALTFAVTGHLTPIVAAILMPVSSVSVVGFSAIAVKYVVAKKLKK